ncbi:MAG: chitobiase/beta-hexosaminidase C-terminal domain-containing protein [Roseburia inulinivorans]
MIYYTTDGTVPTNKSRLVQYSDCADRDDYDPGDCDRRWSYHE